MAPLSTTRTCTNCFIMTPKSDFGHVIPPTLKMDPVGVTILARKSALLLLMTYNYVQRNVHPIQLLRDGLIFSNQRRKKRKRGL